MALTSQIIEQLRRYATEISEREGCTLYDLEFGGGMGGRALRVFIDRAEGQVSIDDCSNVSKGLNLLLDTEDIIPGGRYDLEVSSPGLERKLSVPWHFAKVVGQRVRLKLLSPIGDDASGVKPTSNVEGELISASDERVVVRTDKREWEVALGNVAKAQVVFATAPPEIKLKKKR